MREKLYVGPKLRLLREQQGLTLDACAARLGLSPSYLSLSSSFFVLFVYSAKVDQMTIPVIIKNASCSKGCRSCHPERSR